MKRKITTLLTILALYAAAQDTPRCTATKKDGLPCQGYVQKDSLCYFHNPANRCYGKTLKGEKCGALKIYGTDYCKHHQNQAK